MTFPPTPNLAEAAPTPGGPASSDPTSSDSTSSDSTPSPALAGDSTPSRAIPGNPTSPAQRRPDAEWLRTVAEARVWHRRAGLILAAPLALIVVTGIILVFRSYLKEPPFRLAEADRPAQRLPAAHYLPFIEAVEKARGIPIAEAYFPTAPHEPFEVVLDDDHATELRLNAQGIVLSERRGNDKGLVGFVFSVHTGAILGKPGEWGVAAIGLATLLFLVVVGVFIRPGWWRRSRG